MATSCSRAAPTSATSRRCSATPELSTTQIYTQVSIRALQAIHAATHPAAGNEPHGQRDDSPGGDQARRVAVTELLAALDDEGLEETGAAS